MSRMDAAGTDDVCFTANEDNTPFNDVGGDRGGLGGGASGGGCSNSGCGSSSSMDRPISPRQISKSALKNVDVHTFKRGYVGNDGNRWDLYKDTANNAAIWLGNKAQTLWIATEYVFEELFEYFLKGGK